MNEQSAMGTILFHVVLLAIIVVLVDETLIRAGLAIIPGMLLAQRAMGGGAQAQTSGDLTGIHDQRMDEHVREHVEKLLGHFREFYAMNHLMASGKITSDEAMVRANEIEKKLNRLLDEVSAGPEEAAAPRERPPTATPISPELSTT